MQTKVRIHAIFRGRVQGVFFRDYTRRKSIENSVTGWVRNLESGDVEAIFEGDETKIQAVIDWLRNEHPNARVTDIIIEKREYTGQFRDFEITY